MRVYIDSSALVKRSLDEPESEPLELAVNEFMLRGEVMSSTLAWVEVSRSIRSRLDSEPPAEVAQLVESALAGVIECPVSDQIVGVARRLGPASLRGLDAIHLASATLLGADLVCAYDDRLLRSAEELGFRTVSPGR